MIFQDRRDAGKQLAQKLEAYKASDTVVYALPRGGAVVGDEVAKALGAPLSLVIARKVAHPFSDEFAICAVTESGEQVCDDEFTAPLDQNWLELAIDEERKEARRRRGTYLRGNEPLPAEGKTALIVDDGVATGLTLEAAIKEIQKQKPAKVVAAVPVAPADTTRRIEEQIDDVIAVIVDEQYRGAVGMYYQRFDQTTDEEVVAIMEQYEKRDI